MSLLRWMNDPFDYALRDFEDPYYLMDRANRRMPYWLNHSLATAQGIGESMGEVCNDRDKFTVKVDCSHFRPEELTVNVKNHELVIEGHHEEKTDRNGRIERRFIRKYALPKDANEQNVTCHLSQDGHLTVAAPKAAIEGPQSRNIPIQPAPQAAAIKGGSSLQK